MGRRVYTGGRGGDVCRRVVTSLERIWSGVEWVEWVEWVSGVGSIDGNYRKW